MRAGVTASRARSADSAWQRWADFCAFHHLDPTLQDIRDPVPILQVYLYSNYLGISDRLLKAVQTAVEWARERHAEYRIR